MDNLPKGVREQAEYAEQLLQATFNPQTEAPEPEQPQETMPDPATEAAEQQQHEPETYTETEPDVSTRPEEVKDAAYWERRFKTVDGKYKAEVPRMAEQIRELKERNKALEVERRQLKAKQDAMQGYFDDDDAEEIEEKAQAVEKKLAEQDEIDELRREKAELARDRFFTELTQAIPDWREIDSSEAFTTWLSQLEPITRLPYGELLHKSLDANDSRQAVQIFNAYMQTQNAQTERPAAEKVSANANRIEEELMPGQTRPSAPEAGADDSKDRIGRTWTRAEINQFYKDMTNPEASTSTLRGTTPQQRSAIEKSIFWAQQNGRVR